MTQANGILTIHASAVAIAGRAVMLRGRSGAGKSGLALQLIALGARLIADDRCLVWRDGDHLLVGAPDRMQGRIEARGVGILNAPVAGPQRLALVVDMDAAAPPRLPEPETVAYHDLSVPLLRGSAAAHFPAAIYLYAQHGRFA